MEIIFRKIYDDPWYKNFNSKNMFSQNDILVWKSFSERFEMITLSIHIKTIISFDYVNFGYLRPIRQNCITKLTPRRVHSSKYTMDLPIWTVWIIHRHLCTSSLFFCSQWVEINSEGTLFFHISTFQGLLSLLHEHFIECDCPKIRNHQ